MIMTIWAGIATLAAGLITAFICFANGMRSSPGEFVGRDLIAIAWMVVVLMWLAATAPAHAHDHNRPDLNDWFPTLKSPGGGYCCDGPGHDATHLSDADWETQNKDGSHYRARIPATGADMDKARRGETFESEWVDVPDSAVISEPNRSGMTLVWPTYGYSGRTVRCFMPGPMT